MGCSMINLIFGRRKPPKSADKGLIGGRIPSVLKPLSGSETADLNSQSPTLSAGALSSEERGNNVGYPNMRINGTLFSSNFQPLRSFKDVSRTEKESLLIDKLSLCCTLFEFTDSTNCTREKEIKRQTLLEIAEYIVSADGNGKFPLIVIATITKMVSVNLFRTLRSTSREKEVIQALDFEEPEPSSDPAWPHLEVVYQVLLKFLMSPENDTRLAKRYINNSFILRLVELFDSEDPREREYLKIVLYLIYGNFLVYRPFIRKAICNTFYQFIYETEKHHGIAELLDVFGSIINGFDLPLKEEHKLFLMRTLLPLHKPRLCAVMYHGELSYCITQFVEKDCKLADAVIRGLIRYWPISNSPKEELFLGELEEILQATQLTEFKKCCSLLEQSSSSVGKYFLDNQVCSPDFNTCRFDKKWLWSSAEQVAEKAMRLWKKEHIDNLISQNSKVILPIILPALEKNINEHWSSSVQIQSLEFRQLLSIRNPEIFYECLLKYEEDKAKEDELKLKRQAAWKRLDEIASVKATVGEAVLVSPGLPRQSSLV
ncbi:hypothetical protein EJB05_13112, partial [Eragrostis curvula]